jgi:hypothetical protein
MHCLQQYFLADDPVLLQVNMTVCFVCVLWARCVRQGIGVTGGNPLGFDVGQPAGAAGSTLAGIDLVSSSEVAELTAILLLHSCHTTDILLAAEYDMYEGR